MPAGLFGDVDFQRQGTVAQEHENLWQFSWQITATNVTAIRIFANGQLIYSQNGTPSIFPDSYDWDWNTRGLIADTYLLRIETTRAGVVYCAKEFSKLICPPSARVTAPPPAQPGLSLPNDEFFPTQWDLHNLRTQQTTGYDFDMDLPQAWTIEAGNSDVIVAVCDEGFEWHHRDLRNVMLPGFDFTQFTAAYATKLAEGCTTPASCISLISSKADPGGFDPFACLRFPPACSSPEIPDGTWQPTTYEPSYLDGTPPYLPLTDNDNSWHGARVTGIIAAERNNNWGIAGIAGGAGGATGVRVLPLQITDWNSAGHPGVGIDASGDAIAFNGPAPPGTTVILSDTTGYAQAFSIGLEAGASCLEYVTYLRTVLGVNIRVATFSINGDCLAEETLCEELTERFDRAVSAAWDAGIFIVSAAGNNGCVPNLSSVQTMALRPKVFCVTELTMMSQLADDSACGDPWVCDPFDYEKTNLACDVTIAAPGAQIMTTIGQALADPEFASGAPPVPSSPSLVDSYAASICGTSFTAPHVAGVAALLFSYSERPGAIIAAQYQNLSPASVWRILCKSADNLSDPQRYGAGRVNAYRALLELRGQPNLPGDFNADGKVTNGDVAVLTTWLASGTGGSQPQCLMDVDADGDIDNDDLKSLKKYVLNGYPDLLVRSNCF